MLYSIFSFYKKDSLPINGVPSLGQRGFQTPASPIAEGIFAFHDDLRIFLTGILCFVRYILFVCLYRFAFSAQAVKGTSYRLVHASVLEII